MRALPQWGGGKCVRTHNIGTRMSVGDTKMGEARRKRRRWARWKKE